MRDARLPDLPTNFNPLGSDGSLDMTANLGRRVITTAECLSLIRAELRFSLILAKARLDAIRADLLDGDDDLNLVDGGDIHCEQALFQALRETAMGNVVDWCGDEGVVFDKGRVSEFIRIALLEAEAGKMTPEALAY